MDINTRSPLPTATYRAGARLRPPWLPALLLTAATLVTVAPGCGTGIEKAADTTTAASMEAAQGCLETGEGCPCAQTHDCQLDLSCLSGLCVSRTPRCGDGFRDPGEECDNGSFNADDGVCRSNCLIQS